MCGVFLDQLFENTPEAKSTLAEVMQMVKDGIKDKDVKPLDRTVFSRKEVEEAFRYMAKGVHVGKVLIKVSIVLLSLLQNLLLFIFQHIVQKLQNYTFMKKQKTKFDN